MAQGDNRKLKNDGVLLFRPARSISGTRRRVTTDELEQFKKEQDPPWAPGPPPWSQSPLELPRSDAPPPPAPAGSRPSMPALRSPWLASEPSIPPPPSLWVPVIESTPPTEAVKVAAPAASRSPLIANDALRAGMLSSIAGFVDAAGFLALFGLLPAHMTGDIVWAGAAVAERASIGWLLRIAMVFLFIASVVVAAVAARIVRRRGQSPLASLLSLMTLSLGVFWAAGAFLGPYMTGPEGTATLFISGAGVFAMGIQNAIMREALGSLTPTTVMTGNLTQVTIEVVELAFASFDSPARRPQRRRKEALSRLARFGLPVISFTLGAAAGALSTNALGFTALAFPTAASLLLTAHSFRAARGK
ncbi:MAG TPA: YoaK family protein [Polyangiaceae bacterium]|nr:YoaK family protein [Polyangiaceae bacterium]